MSERNVQRVLVIDDDDLSREVLTLLLGDAGYAVNSASSGGDALAALQAEKEMPDAVLMDWQMPGVSGNELAQRLRELCGPSTRLLAMSGSKVQEEVAAADGFLLKPFSMEEFERALQRPSLRAATEPMAQEPDRSAGSGQAIEHPASAVASTAAPEDEVLDPDTFRGFKAMVGAEALHELYRQCVRDADRHVTAIQTAWTSGDDAGLRKNAHAIKGSLGMVGARELQRLCSVLEESGIADDHAATLAEFPDALERLRRMLIARGVEI